MMDKLRDKLSASLWRTLLTRPAWGGVYYSQGHPWENLARQWGDWKALAHQPEAFKGQESSSKATISLNQSGEQSLESALVCLKERVAQVDTNLKSFANHMVFSDGSPHSQVMVFGEAPGAEEDRQGKPFVGKSGQLLDKMFQFIGLSRDKNLYISNIVPWRPPGNRPPSEEEVKLFLPYVREHIRQVRPSILVAVGATAAKALLGIKTPITQSQGKSFPYKDQASEIPCFCLFHPAYLLRSPKQKSVTWQSLLKLSDQLKNIEKQNRAVPGVGIEPTTY